MQLQQEIDGNISDSSSNSEALGKSFDEKYLLKQSEMSNNNQMQPVNKSSYLADEFLNDNNISDSDYSSSSMQSSYV